MPADPVGMKGLGFMRRAGFAWRGIALALRRERSFRTQAVCGAAAALVTVLLQPGWLWGGMIACAIALVWMAELFNTALEHALDALHPEHSPMIGAAKDCAAGAVLVLSGLSVFLFAAMLLDRFA